MSIQAHKSPSLLSVFLKGEAVSAFWNFITKGIGLLNTFLTITSLTLYQYGVFQLLLSTIGIFFDILNIGGSVVQNEISHALAENNNQRAKRVFLEYSLIRIILALIIWTLLFFGAEFLFNAYTVNFIKDLRIISFLFLSEIIFLIIKMLSIVRLDFFVVGLRSSVNKFVQAIILIYFFSIGDLGLKQLILSIVIASAISTVIVLPYFIKTYNKWNNIALGKALLIGEIFVKYGLWDIMRQISTHTANRIKPWLVKLFVGTEAVAVYSIAELTVSSFQDLLPSKTLQSLIPIWLQDKKLSIKMFSYGVKYFMLTGLVIALFALAIVPIIISNFFPKYNESLPLFYFLIISIPVFGIGIIVGNYIVALRRQKFLFIQHLSRSIFSTVLILVTIPFIGLWGLAIEYVLTPIMMVFSSYIYAKKRNAGFSFDLNIIFSFKREDAEIFKKILNIMYNSMVNTFSFLKR